MIKILEKAVTAARLYNGAMGLPIKTQQRLYTRLNKACERIAKDKGMPFDEVFRQVNDHARVLGAVSPRPGKDY